MNVGQDNKLSLSGHPCFLLTPLYPFTHSEGALCAFACALRQSSSADAGRDPTSYPGTPVTVGPHHGLHGVAPDAHGSLEEEEDEGEWMGRRGTKVKGV